MPGKMAVPLWEQPEWLTMDNYSFESSHCIVDNFLLTLDKNVLKLLLF